MSTSERETPRQPPPNHIRKGILNGRRIDQHARSSTTRSCGVRLTCRVSSTDRADMVEWDKYVQNIICFVYSSRQKWIHHEIQNKINTNSFTPTSLLEASSIVIAEEKKIITFLTSHGVDVWYFRLCNPGHFVLTHSSRCRPTDTYMMAIILILSIARTS